MMTTIHIGVLLAAPAVGAGICFLLRKPRTIFCAMAVVAVVEAAMSGALVWRVFAHGAVEVHEIFHVDALSAFHLGVMALVFLLTSLFAPGHFASEALTRQDAVRYAGLWLGSMTSLTLVLVSNNLGLMWVGIEATTLLTAFLIYVHRSPASLEAMWKYILICSVGVAFAFMGTLLVATAGRHVDEPLAWTHLMRSARALDADTLKMAFIFLVVGYGTKAGLAPMHSWLPDADSQAPAPVAGLFSGFLLSGACYCILRYVPVVEAATGGAGWGLAILVMFGLISIGVAAAFVASQRDVRRFLAYSSIEHLGIVVLGVGLGGLGTFAALFHTLVHGIGKTLAFVSAGRLGQMYGSFEIARLCGTIRTSRVWGVGFLVSALALAGAAPFAPFLSELWIVKAAVDAHAPWVLGLFLAGMAIVFVGAMRHVIGMAWGEPPRLGDRGETRIGHAPERERKTALGETMLVVGALGALLVLGLWIPAPLRTAIEKAAGVIGGGR